MDPRRVWIEANIDEDKIRRVRTGLTVEVEIDSLGSTLAGRVETVSPVTTATLNPTADGSISSGRERVILVKITLDENHPSLIPGSSAKIKIRTP